MIHMFNEEQARDYQPITVIGRLSIYLTELLVGIHVASMVVVSLWMGIFSNNDWGKALFFSPELILQKGQIWRLVSYAFLDYPPSGFGGIFWFLIGLLMLWWCGRQVEQFYGRLALLNSYVLLTMVPATLALLPPFWVTLSGPSLVHFGVFVMFAATYPGVQFMFGIPAKWLAWAILVFGSLVYFATGSMTGLLLLWVTALIGYGLTRWMGRGEWLPAAIQDRLPTFRRKPQFHVVPREKTPPPPEPDPDPVSSIDPILDKIAKRGMGSLTAKERAALQAASGELQRKSGK